MTRLQRKIFLYLFSCYTVIASAVLVFMLRTDDNFTKEQRKDHVVNILSALQLTYSILQDAETGQRGYLITGREEYLSPFESAKTRLTTQLQQLRYLMKAETAYQHQLAQIESLITQKLSELEQTIFLRRTQGFDAARLVVMTHSGKQYMDRIQNFIVKLQAAYGHQKKQAQAQINEHRERTLWSIAAILAIALGFFIWTGVALSSMLAAVPKEHE